MSESFNSQKMMMNPKFRQVMMKPTKPERLCFIISSLFFILFLCAVASIYEVRSGNLLKFGSRTFSSYNSSSCASFIPLNSTSDDIRIFIGILTLPDQYQRRHLLRMIYGTQSRAGAKVDVKFVFCNLTKEDQRILVGLEIMQYDDIIILNCTENMNQGKTYTYFSSLPEMLNSTEGPSPPYHYVMKADDDTYLRLANLVETLRPLPREDLYYGKLVPCRSNNPFVAVMSGLGYLVSWDIVEWISVSEIPKNHMVGPEDRVFTEWLNAGHKGRNRHIAKWKMYDYPEPWSGCTHELWPDTIAVHLLKNQDKWVQTLKYFNVTQNLKPSKLYHIP